MKKVILVLVLVLALFLRLYKLGENPPSLYWDETSLGYNAYTILTTGYDEHGEYLPLDRFIAFGDYKPPGYIYAAVPSIFIFGLNEFAVRFPSMLAGLLIVIITYYLAEELSKNKKIALLSSFFISVSSWAVHFSRAAFEANLAALFNLTGICFFVVSTRKKWAILPAIIFFILSFYTFNANRIIAPLLFIGLCIIYFQNISRNIKWLLTSIIIGFLLIIPSINYLLDRESRLRFQEVSIFNQLETVSLSNQRIEADQNTIFAKILHNRRWLFAKEYFKHYFDNFSGRFLFTHGDVNPRLAIQDMGELYVWYLPFLPIGLYSLFRKNKKPLLVLGLWVLIVPIPAASAKETPHALRILSMMPVYQIITAYGVYEFIYWFRDKTQVKKVYYSAISVICFLFAVNLFYYLHNYYIHYPINWSGEWQYGYRQMVEAVGKIEKDYDYIFITKAYGRPYIYFAFYQKWPLEDFLKEKKATRDWFGFWEVEALGKYRFNLDDISGIAGKILLVTTKDHIPSDFKELYPIKNLQGDDVFIISERK